MENQCEARVYGSSRYDSFHPHQCSRKGKEQIDNKWYCNLHNPIKKKEKDKKKTEEWNNEWEKKKTVAEYEEASTNYCKAQGLTIEQLKTLNLNKANVGEK